MIRRGRRPAGSPDAREAILVAARSAFARDGYKTSLRGVARAAGVDPALVHHYFPRRSELFIESVLGPAQEISIDPAFLEEVEARPGPQQGRALVQVFVSQWDRVGQERFTAVIRGVLGNSEVVDRIRVLIVNGLVLPMVARVAPDQAELRAHLVASQLVGLGMARWVVRLEAVHDASPEELADAVGPTIQRYLTGDISG